MKKFIDHILDIQLPNYSNLIEFPICANCKFLYLKYYFIRQRH